MTPSAALGGGYGQRLPDPGPTVAAVLEAARPGDPEAHLAVIAGPPGVGKSAAAQRLVEVLAGALWLDKDVLASGFVLQAARDLGREQAYAGEHYDRCLRPLEYAASMAMACANLVGPRLVLLVGGWGPELGVPELWTGLGARLAPSRLTVVQLDPPPLEEWRRRMGERGSRTDSPWFEELVRAVTSLPVWPGAVRLSSAPPLPQVVQSLLDLLTPG
ncbi:MAG: hypothetical protein AB1505_29935 [Candidatus Latescibacterota bacterium]